ncbi:MAG: hypothetical protein JWN93_2526 [Hyphomicrobiales bacterium]|nr:hypothetical protein [Hyphomicrobiales bacterium]
MNLFVLGLGYSSLHYVRTRGATYARVVGTVRSAAKRDALRASGVEAFVFSQAETQDGLAEALAGADRLLVSIPPGTDGDPVLASALRDVILAAPDLRRIVYLSTIGVYGDHGGAWIDEEATPAPSNARSVRRLEAEQAWRDLAREKRTAVHVLRLAGIYGPGQNALVNLAAGTAKRIVKPGQVFNRIHVEDIGRAIDAAFAHADPEASAVWNVSDDEPAPPQDVVAYAARLMNVAPPPELDFDSAPLSPMARSFYGECKRVRNAAMKAQLGVSLAYPTYREALQALWRAREGRAS